MFKPGLRLAQVATSGTSQTRNGTAAKPVTFPATGTVVFTNTAVIPFRSQTDISADCFIPD